MADPTQRHDIAGERADGPDATDTLRGDPRRVEVLDLPEPSWNEHDGSFEWGPEPD